MRASSIAFLLLVLIGSGSVWSNDLPWDTSPSTAWPASHGQARIQFGADFLPGLGIQVSSSGRFTDERFDTTVNVKDGALWIYAPFGNFERFVGGELSLDTPIELHGSGGSVVWSGLRLVPAMLGDVPSLQVLDSSGRHLANVTHSHIVIQHRRNQIIIHNADIKASEQLGEILGVPEIAGLAIGQLWIDLGIEIPADVDLSSQDGFLTGRGDFCADRPYWPQDGHEVDVGLINIGSIAGGGFEPGTGRLKITPSATLKNLGQADVPWFRQLAPAPASLYPHEPRDQHPFLVWNLYRIADGQIEHLAASGTKHAFLTINVNCPLTNCGNSNILWPECEDTYGVFNNDSSTYQGPRSEIIASQGLWESCNSFFDSDCDGSQNGFSGNWNNRLLVDPAELNDPGARYFVDAWYVIQYDINIWNTMGYHEVNPTPGGSGGYFMNPGPFVQSLPVNEWVAENTTDPLESHEILVIDGPSPEARYPANMPSGHARILAKAEDLGNGDYRYRYAVMNYDFDHGFEAFEIPLPPGAVVSDTFVGGPDDVMTTPWTVSIGPEAVRFQAPNGQKLPWFTLYNFEITVDQAPAASSNVALVPVNTPSQPLAAHIPETFFVDVPAPAAAQTELIFEDRFEQN